MPMRLPQRASTPGSAARAVTMPFGKHKGELISELPVDYLRWLRENTDLRGDLATAVELALEDAGDGSPGEGWERFGSGWRKR